MTSQKITLIPVHEIRIVNPRSRNRLRFHSVMTSIGTVGLKKPITVHQRPLAEDGTRYDLVCGQGRLESVKELGDTMIPALITDAPEDERYLISLVENLARRPPSTRELLREVKRLMPDYRAPAIAKKLGMDRAHIYGIIGLLQHGEEELIARVEAGSLPLETAVVIASGKDTDIQRALSEAYDNGMLRGTRLREAQRLVRRRRKEIAPGDQQREVTGTDLMRVYEHHTQQQRAIVRRSANVTHRIAVLTSSLRRLFSDEHFVTLLRAEGLPTLPEQLASKIASHT
ncbi:MAG: ParB/RepB/Spo0J family partition protein [Bryobacteraceae bacterium]